MTGKPRLACGDDRRRKRVRDSELIGLDYLEVRNAGHTLRVYFLGKVPQRDRGSARKWPARARRGRRSCAKHRGRRCSGARGDNRPDLVDDYMDVVVGRRGDPSPYVLKVSGLEEAFDLRYSSLEFSFGVDNPGDLDCKVPETSPLPRYAEPEIDYLAKDYASFRQLILDRLALIMPNWQERHTPDLGITLVELLAYVGDQLSYYQDAVATEAYLETARQRVSVRRHARLIDYYPHEGCNARAWACIRLEAGQDLISLEPEGLAFLAVAGDPEGIDAGLTQEELRTVPPGRYEWFEPMHERRVALRPRDILDPAGLAERLLNPAEEDSLSQYLAEQLPRAGTCRRDTLAQPPRMIYGAPSRGTQPTHTDRYPLRQPTLLRWMLDQGGAEDELHQEVGALAEQRPREQEEIGLLNRLILEVAYPEIARSGRIYLRAAHDQISFWTWGEAECCLPRGATAATLRDRWVEEIRAQTSRRSLRAGRHPARRRRTGSPTALRASCAWRRETC